MWMVVVGVLVLVGLLVLAGLVKLMAGVGEGKGKPKGGLEYESRGALLTEAEAAFYPVLVEAARAGPPKDPLRRKNADTSPAGAGEEHVVMCKVRLGDLVRPRKGVDKGRKPGSASRATTLRNKVNQKHVDFVVVRASDFGVVAAVELDDSSHQRAKVKERDGFVDGALESAGVRLVRVKWGRGYDLEAVAGVLWGEGGAAAV